MELKYDERGQGNRSVLLLHGGACSRAHWQFQLDGLASDFRAIAVDLPGHGESYEATDDFTYEHMVQALEGFVRARGLESISLVGHSLGATLSLPLAEELGSRVSHVVLVDPMPDTARAPEAMMVPFLKALDETPYALLRTNAEAYLGGALPLARRLALEDIDRTHPKAVFRCVQSLKNYDVVRAKQAISAKLAAVVSPYNTMPFSLHAVLGISPIVIPGVSHWLQLDAPDATNRAIRDALEA